MKKMVSCVRFVLAMTSAVVLVASAIADPSMTTCNSDKIKNATSACDSLVAISQIKCEDKLCHKALHFLTKNDTINCYEELGMGVKTDLVKFKKLDEFCHGEGSDPAEADNHEHDEFGHSHGHELVGGHSESDSVGQNSTSAISKPSMSEKGSTPSPTNDASDLSFRNSVTVAFVSVLVVGFSV